MAHDVHAAVLGGLTEGATGQSFVAVAFTAFARRLDPDSGTRQRLAQHLDFGVDAPQVGNGAPFHRVKNRFLRPEREGHAFRAPGAVLAGP
jgi:hypothetical protein